MAAVCKAVFLGLFLTAFAIPEENFYPFAGSTGDVSLPRVLDNSSPAIMLSITHFPYFGQNHNQLFVSIVYRMHACICIFAML